MTFRQSLSVSGEEFTIVFVFPAFSSLNGTNDDCEFIGRAVNSELTSIPKDHYMFLGTYWVHCSRYECFSCLDISATND